MSFQYFVSSISVISVIIFFVEISFLLLWLKLFLDVLLFVTIVYGIAFLISVSNNSLLANSNTTDFCMVTSYPITLLDVFISSVCVGEGSRLWGSLCITHLCLPHFLFGCYLPLSPASLLWLDLAALCSVKVVKVGILILFQVLKRKLSAFCYLYCNVSYWHSVNGFYYIEVHFLYTYFV